MSAKEGTGKRSLVYSQWHRVESLKRFIGEGRASQCCAFDLDMVEVRGNEPVALFEITLSEIEHKANNLSVRMTGKLGRMAGIPAYIARYVVSEETNPGSPMELKDISCFEVKMIAPTPSKSIIMTPDEYATFLWELGDEQLFTPEELQFKSDA